MKLNCEGNSIITGALRIDSSAGEKVKSSKETCQFLSHRILSVSDSCSKYLNISTTINIFAGVYFMHLDIKFAHGFYSWNQIQLLFQ